ncbi:hypothetical protein BDA99DRAFT_524053 [Phascolomyces articulosus]|uniref:Uncharacterized protein n=1 Tax=Phascolomyces articulosus TaxID=60185 RepID=A0AAD5K082_9FUNG|nr:hypothetical protein BDA99DRAFT_524053 [Phascolomyces articulosus]
MATTPFNKAKFVDSHRQFIINSSKVNDALGTIWPLRFGNAARCLKIDISSSKVDWRKIAEEVLKKRQVPEYTKPTVIGKKRSSRIIDKLSTSSTSSSVTITGSISVASSSESSLLIEDRQAIEKVYADLDDETLWTLSTGTIVEKQMERLAVGCSYEHPCHSLILDLDDSIRFNYFTESEINEIREYNTPNLPALPKNISDYLKKYKGKHSTEEIFEVAHHPFFHPRKDADLHWVHQAILRGLDLIFYEYLKSSDHTEGDIMRRVCGTLVEECFDESNFIVRSDEKSCESSSESKNICRSLPSSDPLARKATGTKVDMLIKYLSEEYGCAEASRKRETSTTKELKESMFKCPKIIKDMFYKVTKSNPTKVHDLLVVGFVITGLRLTILTLDCPARYACRIYRFGPLQYPD